MIQKNEKSERYSQIKENLLKRRVNLIRKIIEKQREIGLKERVLRSVLV
jgi:hypothetical protein